MSNRPTRLRELDRLAPPDLQAEVDARLRRQSTEIHRDPPPFPHGPRRFATGVAVGLALSVLVGALAWWGLSSNVPSPTASPSSAFPVRIQLPGPPQPIAAGEGGAWVVVGTSENGNELWRIDGATNHAQELTNTRGAGWPTVGMGAVWVTCMGANNPCSGPSVLNLDPATGATLAVVPLLASPFQISTGLDSVWVKTNGGLVKIDPATARVATVFPMPQGTLAYNQVGTAGGSLWTAGFTPDRLYRIDPETGNVLTTINVKDPCIFATSNDAVWISTCLAFPGRDENPDQLTKFDAGDGHEVLQTNLTSYGKIVSNRASLYLARRDPNDPELIQVI